MRPRRRIASLRQRGREGGIEGAELHAEHRLRVGARAGRGGEALARLRARRDARGGRGRRVQLARDRLEVDALQAAAVRSTRTEPAPSSLQMPVRMSARNSDRA